MEYKILDYSSYKERMTKLTEAQNVRLRIIKEAPLTYTRFDFPVDHYTIGRGANHILVIGGTHGNELISVDFVTQLMGFISRGEYGFDKLDPNEFTIDFIPLQNPEGFVINTTTIKKLIKNDMSDEEIEKICKEYYLAFRQDDINYKTDPQNKELKNHQKLFADITPDDLSDENYILKENVKRLWDNYPFPPGSMISWLSNGSGVDLNANNPDNPRIEEIYDGRKEICFASGRYNNIPNNIPSPIGIPCLDKNNFQFESENICIFDMVANLHESENYLALFTYHGTGGLIFHNPFCFDPSTEWFQKNKRINKELAECYAHFTEYKTSGLNILDKATLTGDGDLLRSFLPAVLLIELSKMGGNPIGPYGDKETYLNTIKTNALAFAASLELIRERQDEIKYNFLKNRSF